MNKSLFIRKLAHELSSGDLAVFIGAGLSMASGGVSWSVLLRDIAEELGLDISKEKDLVSVAQYYVNAKNQNKGALVQSIYDQLNLRDAEPNENHSVLAKMPIERFWTTNYDELIEKALSREKRSFSSIYENKQFLTPLRRTSARIYKMHGDIRHPSEVVITRADFEKYHHTHSPFINALSGDLATNTFLFLGLSFTDPNLFYVLSRLHVEYDESVRPHYAIMKRFSREEFESDEDFEYSKIRQNLAVNDLVRYNITVLLVDEHREVTEILREMDKMYRKNTIFISGSAHEYGYFSQEETSKLLESVIDEQFSNGRRIISGYGLGLGDMIVGAAVRKAYSLRNRSLEDHLLVRPFPQTPQEGENIGELWEAYRQDMISRSGIAIFIFGNKMINSCLERANGVYREYEIARELGLNIVPVGSTGYEAARIWEEVNSNFESFYPDPSEALRDAFTKLNLVESEEEVARAVNRFIGLIMQRRM